jgi:hypothetical protein
VCIISPIRLRETGSRVLVIQYPDTSPPDIYKWEISSCVPCNRALGAIEKSF